MNKNYDKLLRKLLSCSLVLALMLSQTAIVFAAGEVSDEQGSDVTVANGAGSGESLQEEAAAVPETNSAPETAAEETPKPEDEDMVVSEPAVEVSEAAETVTEEVAKAPAASASDAAGTIHIGDTSFDPEDEESSHWQDGKGWKNISGQYVAMVDYDGSEETITADGGVVTLAVAGVNRIGSLTGDCSIRIIGTGIVLIDNLELGEGNYLSLHPNTALYEEGSAAVFVKNQEDGSYRLINGEVTALLDEEYIVNNTDLTIPDGCKVVLSAISEVINGELVEYGSRVIIGNGSTLTVSEGASVSMKKLKSQMPHIGVGEVTIEAELIIKGAVNVLGVIEGGFIDIEDGGTLSGTGSVKSAEVCLEPKGNLDVSVEESTLTINGNADGSVRTASATVNNSIIYLKGYGIDLANLNVSGSSTLSVDTRDYYSDHFNKVGNITLSQGANLDIAANNYDNSTDIGTGYDDLVNMRDGLKDSYLEIYGAIKGGTVSVLAGCVRYTGTQTDVYPAVPEGYISRVIVNGNGITSTDDPLNMTKEAAVTQAAQTKVPVIGYMVYDEWDTQKGMFRVWKVNTKYNVGSVARNATYPDLLNMTGLLDEDGHVRSQYNVAIELIYSDFSRDLLKTSQVSHTAEDGSVSWEPISLNNVVLIRVLEYWATGGFGGSSNTHVSSSFTGSGVIGGPGSGYVTTGSGTVVYGTQTEESDPVNPEPVNPLPVVPATYDSGNGAVITKTNTGTGLSEANTDALVVNLTLRKPTAETPAGTPQIWQLNVTKAGIPVTDLKGTPVRVTVPFTAPKDWGTPTAEEIAGYDLYAVFADEDGNLTAYAAQYDLETGEVLFDAEQTGDFVIVRFAYEKELFDEEFYKALAELKEVQAFLEELQR